MSETLVIHPYDESTEDLYMIYQDSSYDVIRDPDTSSDDIEKAIESHSKIIMLGHGTQFGLFAPTSESQFGRYIIDDSFADLLRTKETISVWCNSDEFFRMHRIPGFHTGMIVSEAYEAELVGCYETYENETDDDFQLRIRKNLNHLARLMRESINLPPVEMRDYILERYTSEDDSVIRFNRRNILVL